MTSRTLTRLAVAPLAVLMTIAAALVVIDTPLVFESRLLFVIFNTAFMSIMPLPVAYVAARGYQTGGSVSLLLVGCGVLTFGVGTLSAGWLAVDPSRLSNAATVHGISALLGAVFHVAGAATGSSGSTPQPLKRTRLVVALAYLGVLVVVGMVIAGSLAGIIPPFLTPAREPTLLRQLVLGSATTLFAVAASLLAKPYLRTRLAFSYRYVLALALIAFGLFAISLSSGAGTPWLWIGWAGQYLGATYALIAVVTTIGATRSRGISLETAIATAFRDTEANLWILAETAADALVAFDDQQRILMWNRGAETMFGYRAGEVLGTQLIDLVAAEDSVADRVNYVGRPGAAGEDSHLGRPIRTRPRRRVGPPFPVELTASARRAGTGETVRAGEGKYAGARTPLGHQLPAGQDIIGHVAQTGRPLLVADVLASPFFVPCAELPDARSEVAVPVRRGDRILGVLDIQVLTPDAFHATDEETLSILAGQLAVALENARLYQETQNRLERLTALQQIDAAITASVDLRVTLNILLDHVLSQLEVDAANVLLLDPHSRMLEYAAGRHPECNLPGARASKQYNGQPIRNPGGSNATDSRQGTPTRRRRPGGRAEPAGETRAVYPGLRLPVLPGDTSAPGGAV